MSYLGSRKKDEERMNQVTLTKADFPTSTKALTVHDYNAGRLTILRSPLEEVIDRINVDLRNNGKADRVWRTEPEYVGLTFKVGAVFDRAGWKVTFNKRSCYIYLTIEHP